LEPIVHSSVTFTLDAREAALEVALAILVVEDDQSIQSIVAEALSDGGFEPTIASSGEEALSLLSANKYRILVIDIKLGKDRIRGWDVARRVRAINPGLPVVYITGAAAEDWAVQGVPNSILLTKPAVSQLLNTGSPIA
jgi:DNA-binding response OmpR family regulator